MRLTRSMFVLALLASCDRAPTEPADRVQVSLSASTHRVAPGDSLTFTSRAFNPTAERIQIGFECGPSFDVNVRAPSGEVSSALASLAGPDAAFTCELAQHHFAEPGSATTLTYPWRAPAQRGVYVAHTGLRRNGTLSNPSAPISIVVR